MKIFFVSVKSEYNLEMLMKDIFRVQERKIEGVAR